MHTSVRHLISCHGDQSDQSNRVLVDTSTPWRAETPQKYKMHTRNSKIGNSDLAPIGSGENLNKRDLFCVFIGRDDVYYLHVIYHEP